MAAKGWTKDDFALASELKSAEQSQALCDNKIDAMVFTVGHPSGSIKEATTSCDTVLVAVSGPEIDKLVADNPYYRKADHPGRHVPGNPDDVADLRCRRDLRLLDQHADGCRLRGGQGGVRELRRLQEAASGLRQPEERGDDQGRSVGPAARRCGQVLQGSRAGCKPEPAAVPVSRRIGSANAADVRIRRQGGQWRCRATTI